MSNLQELKAAIRDALPDLDCVIAWEQGFDPAHATPLFIYDEKDIERVTLGPACVHNLATYLPRFKGKRIGIVAKGCDTKTINQLVCEGLIDASQVHVIGVTDCKGVLSHAKLAAAVSDLGRVKNVEVDGEKITVTCGEHEHRFELNDMLADKCLTCTTPSALLRDACVENETSGAAQARSLPSQEAFEAMTTDEKAAFWKKEMSRCVRCYACRNACPMCVCRAHCLAESRDPLWLSQDNSPRENLMFQMIHVSHLAGRCTGCGECERACPMGIPLMYLRRAMNSVVKEVFEHEAGMKPEQTPPLLTFKVEEESIKERKL